MNVGLLPSPSDEQSMLLEVSIRFMEAQHPLATVRARADGAEYDETAYRRSAAELGWFGLLAQESVGGGSASGNGVLDAALLAAERGALLQPGPFVGHSTVVHALAGRSGPELSALVRGEHWATWVPPTDGLSTLKVDPSGFSLDGRVGAVADASACRWLLLAADGPDGPTQVLVPTDTPGLRMHRLDGLDVTRRWAAIELVGVAVEASQIVATTADELNRQAQLTAVLSAAESVGAMHADFAMALQYAKDRIAFGRPIGSFQAIKHLLADASLWLEMCKGLVSAAATALGHGAEDGAALAHAAKAFVAERSIDLAQDCFQVFGGIGYTWEHDQHLYLRRLAADAASFGSAEAHRARLLEVVA